MRNDRDDGTETVVVDDGVEAGVATRIETAIETIARPVPKTPARAEISGADVRGDAETEAEDATIQAGETDKRRVEFYPLVVAVYRKLSPFRRPIGNLASLAETSCFVRGQVKVFDRKFRYL